MQITKTPAEFTGFVMLRHKACGAATRIEVGQHYFDGYGPDDQPLTKSIGQIVVTGEWPYQSVQVACSGCGVLRSLAYATPIYGHYVAELKCGTRCRGAVGPSCDCSCGGAQHGSNH